MLDESWHQFRETILRSAFTADVPPLERIRRLKDILGDFQAHIEAALAEAVEAGDLAEIDTRATVSAMVAYIEGLSLMAKTNNDPVIVEKLGPAVLGLAVLPGQG
ncbi:MAG: TetR family transcriptional regulator C-terminal domain-containing protein [Thiogranum sp.]